MAAKDAIIQTYQLVENIMLHLPPKSIWKVRLVSKMWHDMIENTKQLREARCVYPNQRSTETALEVIYEDQQLRPHPTLGKPSNLKASHIQLAGMTLNGRYFFFSEWHLKRLGQSLNEYVTFPPCTAVNLEMWPNQDSTVYDRGGIKIVDLLEVWQSMRLQTHHSYHGPMKLSWIEATTIKDLRTNNSPKDHSLSILRSIIGVK